jgi:hypothetical protein
VSLLVKRGYRGWLSKRGDLTLAASISFYLTGALVTNKVSPPSILPVTCYQYPVPCIVVVRLSIWLGQPLGEICEMPSSCATLSFFFLFFKAIVSALQVWNPYSRSLGLFLFNLLSLPINSTSSPAGNSGMLKILGKLVMELN